MPLSRRHLPTIALATLGLAGWLTWGGIGHRRAPAVAYTLLDGQRLNSAQWAGKVVLVNFWATSCNVCVAEMPELVATFERFRSRGFETLAVAMRHDPPARVSDFAQSRRLPFGVAIDNTGEIADRFGDIPGTPTTFVIDRRGQIVRRIVGAPDFKELRSLVERLLAEA